MKRLFLCALLLGACTDQAIIDAAYPDREKFAFASLDKESIFTYTCAADDNTKDKIIDAGDASQSRAIARALDTEIEDIVEQTEARFQCLFIQARDV